MFEKIYVDGICRELIEPIEKHCNIELTDEMKRKYKIAKNLCSETIVIDLGEAQPPPIPEILDMPELEKAIKEGANEKSESESSKRKYKKNAQRADKSSMESVQKELPKRDGVNGRQQKKKN